MRKTAVLVTAFILVLMISGCGGLSDILSAQIEKSEESLNGEETNNSEEASSSSETDASNEEELVKVTLGQHSGSYSASDEYERCSLEVTVIEGAIDVNLICRKGQENWASGAIDGDTFSAGITGYDEYQRTGNADDLLSGWIDVTFHDSSATVTVKWVTDNEANTYEMEQVSDDTGKTIEITNEIYEQYQGYLK